MAHGHRAVHSGHCGQIRMIVRGLARGIFERPLPGNRVAAVPAGAYLNSAARSGVRAPASALNCLTGDGRTFRRTLKENRHVVFSNTGKRPSGWLSEQ